MAIPPILPLRKQPSADLAPSSSTPPGGSTPPSRTSVADQLDIAPETSDPEKALHQVLELKKALQTTDRSIDVASAGLTLKRVQELLRED